MTTSAAQPLFQLYTDPIAGLPDEAFLGSLLWFSISEADVHLQAARDDLTARGLDNSTMRKILRPVDAYQKAAREFARKFKPVDGVRSELLVRTVGGERHLILERVSTVAGQRKQLFYEKVGELRFSEGAKIGGVYTGYGVESVRTTSHLAAPLLTDEDLWLTQCLAGFEGRFNHLLHYMDSHAVRGFVRDFIGSLNGTCVKETGGLYFVAQKHTEEIRKLGEWVRAVGSSFHFLPLLNIGEQRDMIQQAFEDETVREVERLMAEVAEILKDKDRQITEGTFDQYGLRAGQLAAKVKEYNETLGARSSRASIEIQSYVQQIQALAGRIRQTPSTRQQVAAA